MTKISERELKTLRPGARITDDAIEGFVARCLPSGKISFGYQFTNAAGKRKWIGIGLHGAVTADEARTLAKKYAGQVAGKRDPAAELAVKVARAENTVNAVLDKFLEHHVAGEKLRSAVAIKATLANHVRPELGDKIIYDLSRGEIMRWIDALAKKTPRMANLVLGYMRGAFHWWMLRDEKFHSPIVRGMVKDKTARRTRVLTEIEIADLWRALDSLEHAGEYFAPFVKVLLLTACRRSEVADMHTREIDGNKWTIPAARYKTKIDHEVPLIPAVKKLLPKTFGFVFSSHIGKGKKPINGFGKTKDELDAKIAEIRRREGRAAMPAWTFHDLRRTARTLMAKLKIDRDTAEAVLGHSKGAIVETYDQYKRFEEKTHALTTLAVHVERIVKANTPAATRATKLRLVAR